MDLGIFIYNRYYPRGGVNDLFQVIKSGEVPTEDSVKKTILFAISEGFIEAAEGNVQVFDLTNAEKLYEREWVIIGQSNTRLVQLEEIETL
ncbi:hypothetical protein RGL50_004177 [Vibrio alginolyticus]|nr:hypothetical protein [Vibrio alginolyticus]